MTKRLSDKKTYLYLALFSAVGAAAGFIITYLIANSAAFGEASQKLRLLRQKSGNDVFKLFTSLSPTLLFYAKITFILSVAALNVNTFEFCAAGCLYSGVRAGISFAVCLLFTSAPYFLSAFCLTSLVSLFVITQYSVSSCLFSKKIMKGRGLNALKENGKWLLLVFRAGNAYFALAAVSVIKYTVFELFL